MATSLQVLSLGQVSHSTPEGLTDSILHFQNEEHPLKARSRDKIHIIEIKAELGSDVLINLLPFMSNEMNICTFKEGDTFPTAAVGKLFLAKINKKEMAVLQIQMKVSKLAILIKVCACVKVTAAVFFA